MTRIVSFALALVLLTSPVAAEEPPGEAAAHFDRGLAYFTEGNMNAALSEFQAAHRLSGRWEVLFNIGVTQHRLFRYHEAVLSLERYLAEGGEQVPAERREPVRAKLLAIAAATAEVTVRVPGASARIEVDGWFAGDTPLTRPLLIGPGNHVIVARRAGERPGRREVEVVSGAKLDVELQPTPVARTGTLSVRSRPDGAELTLDGRKLGRAPWRGEVAPGGYQLRAAAPGHDIRLEQVVLLAGQSRSLTLVLSRTVVKRPRPWYKTPAAITAFAVVGVGALATGGYFLFRPEQPDALIEVGH